MCTDGGIILKYRSFEFRFSGWGVAIICQDRMGTDEYPVPDFGMCRDEHHALDPAIIPDFTGTLDHR